MTNDEKQEFYAHCSEILGIEHDWNEPVPRRTRWNTRRIGNGRFPGFGLIRCYNEKNIIVMSKAGTKHFTSCEAVIKHLEQA
jgi:hypothetical protein